MVAMTSTPAHEIPLAVRRRAIAVHEAGHALVAILLKREVTDALLRPPDGLSGETRFEGEPVVMLDLNVRANRHFVEEAIIILLAGQIAEAEYWSRLAQHYVPHVTSHRTDNAEIHKLRAQLGFSPEQDAMLMGYCAERVTRIIHHPRTLAAIDEAATHLAERLSIARAELDRIIHRHDLAAQSFQPAGHPWGR